MEFCESFNDKTKKIKVLTTIPVVITAYSDKTFTYTTKSPLTFYLLKKAVGIEKEISTPWKQFGTNMLTDHGDNLKHGLKVVLQVGTFWNMRMSDFKCVLERSFS
jgi:ribosomal protein L11